MRIIPASYEILDHIDGEKILKSIEKFGRVCYKSENKITSSSAKEFINMIIKNGHESVLEHEKITVRFICDRGISHEIVRHRIASYSQESTRYCNYANNRFGHEITYIRPCFWNESQEMYSIWKTQMGNTESVYLQLIEMGAAPEQARSILPNSLKTEIVVSMNIREWRHFFKLRTSKKAHPQMREITIPLLKDFQRLVPIVFDDIQPL